MKKLILAGMFVCAGIVMSAGVAQAEMHEGKWSMTMTTKMEGMPGAADAMKEMEKMSPEDKAMMQQMMGKMGVNVSANGSGMTTTITQCMTNQKPVPSAKENCKETHSFQGNTVQFESVCPDSTANGQVTYENQAMHGIIHSRQTDGSNVTILLSGQYLGPCDR